MYRAGGNEQQIGFAKRFTRIPAEKLPTTSGDNINLILCVWRLRIGSTRRVNFNLQTPVFKHGKGWKPLLVTPSGVELGCGFGYGLEEVQLILMLRHEFVRLTIGFHPL